MIRTHFLLAAAAASFLFAGSAAAQVTETGTANASIVEALTLTEDVQLDFGSIVPAALGDTVTVDRVANTQTCPASTCSGHALGQWTVTGSDQVVTVSAESPVTLSDGGVNTMSATIDAPATVTIAGGSVTFNTGGVLTVGALQAEGDYSASYDVTVDYQ